MPRITGPLLACALALASAPANAQAGATPPTPGNGEGGHPATPSELRETSAQPPTADDVCRALEQAGSVLLSKASFCWLDVLIHAEEIGRVVALLNFGQTIIVLSVCRANSVLALVH